MKPALHTALPGPRPPPRRAGLAALAALTWCLAALPAAAETAALPPQIIQQTLALATQAAQSQAPAGARVQATVGALDPRLQLAPCTRIEPRLLAGVPAWGRTRVGLHCLQGATAWKVQLPVTVQVWAPALVLGQALPAGARLDTSLLSLTEIDWGSAAGRPFENAAALDGRVLARPLAAGQAPRPTDLRVRQWFAAGDTVQVLAVGAGFAIRTEGQALSPGIEGQNARVRTEGGRVISGRPVGERRLELEL